MDETESWKLAGERKHVSNLRNGTIQSYLSSREVMITEMDCLSLLEELASGRLSSREVTMAFCHRAAVAYQMIYCLHEISFVAALRDADVCDMYIRKYGKPIGALHGLPVSLKDVFNIKGVDTTMGFVGLLGNAKKISSESQIVSLLRRLGAVLYVKTSVPTGSFTGDAFNNIIQYTPNPCNRRLTVGGSSGGEGGLLALKGSPLGVGTDIGGSVRVPAVWNGCYGLRPSTGRIPSEGTASIVDGQMAIPFVLGFMAPSAEAITLATRSLLSLGPWMDDPLVHEIPWREDIYTKFKESASGRSRLSFGVMRTDHYVNVQPPVQRAMDIMVHRIRSLGHSVIDWNPPSHQEAFALWKKAVTIDGGKAFHEAIKLSGEPPHRVDLGSVDAARPMPATVFGLSPQLEASATEINGINIAIRDYRRSYLDYWNRTAGLTGTGKPVDVFLMPVAPTPAPAPGKVHYFGYTTVVNVLDFTACAVPVTELRRDKDRPDTEKYTPLNQLDELIHDDYDPEFSDGAPVGVQIIGRRLQEEKVLAIAEVLGSAVKGFPERVNIKL